MSADLDLLGELHRLALTGKNGERKASVGYLDGLILREFSAEIEARRDAGLAALWAQTGWTAAEFDRVLNERIEAITAAE